MRRAFSWIASISLHGLLVGIATTRLVLPLLEEEPPACQSRSEEGAETVEIEILFRSPAATKVPELQARDASPASSRYRGESIDFVSDRAFRGKTVYDAVGTGPGAGGSYGATPGPGERESGSPSAARATDRDALRAALAWLARHQDESGTWTRPRDCACPQEPGGTGEVASTALSVLALLESGDRGPVVLLGLSALRLRRDPAGRIGTPADHALATLALVHAYRLTRSDSFAGPAKEAAAWLAAHPSSGFWPALALRCAWESDLEFSRGARPAALPAPNNKVVAWFSEAVARRDPVHLELLHDRIVRAQCRRDAGCRDGSWDPTAGENRAMTTALAALTLLQR